MPLSSVLEKLVVLAALPWASEMQKIFANPQEVLSKKLLPFWDF